jgi:hypothetical protein
MDKLFTFIIATLILFCASRSAVGDDGFTCGTCFPDRHPSVRQQFGAAPPSALGQKRILIYRVDFSNFVGAAISSNAAATLISDLNNTYRDMSYGLDYFRVGGSRIGRHRHLAPAARLGRLR